MRLLSREKPRKEIMEQAAYDTFVRDHADEIVKKIIELDSFDDADIAMLKRQIGHGIAMRKKMPVVPMEEIRQLMVGYVAILIIEEEIEFKF